MNDRPDSRETIFELLTDIAPELESLDEIDVTANLREQIDLDSMDFLNLIEGISDRMRIEIPEKDYRQLFSFDDIVAYVESRNGSDGG